MTSVTLNTVRATQSGNSLTIGNVFPEGVFNGANAFDATTNSAGTLPDEKSIKANTATPPQVLPCFIAI